MKTPASHPLFLYFFFLSPPLFAVCLAVTPSLPPSLSVCLQLFFTGIVSDTFCWKTSEKQGAARRDCFVSLFMPAGDYSSNDDTLNEREVPLLLFPLSTLVFSPLSFVCKHNCHSHNLGSSTLLRHERQAKLPAAVVSPGGFRERRIQWHFTSLTALSCVRRSWKCVHVYTFSFLLHKQITNRCEKCLH